MTNNAERILKYFRGQTIASKRTSEGVFVPANLDTVNDGFEFLIDKGVLDTRKVFCDAGSGDRRIVALASGGYGISSFGVECDPKLVVKSRENLKRLELSRVVSVAEGDFVLDKVYESINRRFEEGGTFFNYWSGEKRIASKIAMQSPRDTLFLFLYNKNYGSLPDFRGLTRERTLCLSEREFLGVYKK
ncbi:MAG: hypothetical protein Q8P81_03975 [Nanoarchaeota archaeon]|nr:hypothetical protein [Nanoarchaeota archaeon]